MKKYFYLLLLSPILVLSQVKDISFTLSPFADYTFFDKEAGLENAFSVGGKLGFGFGEYLELRAVYLQSIGLKTNFSDFGLTNYDENLFNQQDINLTRFGGEIKANLGRGRFIPYLTIGSGVQNIEIKDGNDFDQIYSNVGLGFKTKLNDRIVFTIEGKYNRFNFNAGKNLLTEDNKTDFGVTDADFDTKLLTNWSAQASLQFYLGGRKPGTLNDLDKAYFDKFRNGFKGIQFIVEPSVNYIKFDEKSLFRDTYLLGVYAGFDFNQYIGIRGFYFRATENDQISTTFDQFSMYGMELRARLNDGNGVTPYLILGGGYLNTLDGYQGKNGFPFDSQEFAQAGLGLNIPLSKNILITGGVRGLITSASDVEDLQTPEDFQTHIMYNVGLKLAFGGKKSNPNDVYDSQVNQMMDEKDAETQEYLRAQLAERNMENKEKLATLKEEYQQKIADLEIELENAKRTNNVDKAVEVLEQKKTAEKALEDVNEIEKKSKTSNIIPAKKATEEAKEEILVAPKKVKVIQKEKPAKVVDSIYVKTMPIEKDSTSKAVTAEEVQAITPAKSAKTSVKATAAEVINANQPKELIKMTPQELEQLIDQVMEYERTNNVAPDANAKEIEKLKKRIDVLEKELKVKNKVAPVVAPTATPTAAPVAPKK
jgi:opacity protein-like surface antigen